MSVWRVSDAVMPRRVSSARSSLPTASAMSFSTSPPGTWRPGFPGSGPPWPGSTTITWCSRRPVVGLGAATAAVGAGPEAAVAEAATGAASSSRRAAAASQR